MAVKDLTPQYDLTSGAFDKYFVSAVFEALRSPGGGSPSVIANLAAIPDNLWDPDAIGDGSGTRINKILITDDHTKIYKTDPPPEPAASRYADGGLVIYLNPHVTGFTGSRETTLAETLANEIKDWTLDGQKLLAQYVRTGSPIALDNRNRLGFEAEKELAREVGLDYPEGADHVPGPRPPGSPVLYIYNTDRCFAAGTPILMADGTEKPIQAVRPGDEVMAFDPRIDDGRGMLVACRVRRLFTHQTDEWLLVRGISDDAGGNGALVVTPDHRFLSEDGIFRHVDEILGRGQRVVLADGSLAAVTAERVSYSGETASLYESSDMVEYHAAGSVALAPHAAAGWKTYNFEVERLHTYVAGGVRVHNDCVPTLSVNAVDFANLAGHPFNGSQQDIDAFKNAVISGELPVSGGYLGEGAFDRYKASFDSSTDKIVFTGDPNAPSISTVSNNFLQHITSFPANGQRIDTLFSPDGARRVTTTDLADQFDWSREIKSIHPDGLFDAVLVGDNGNISRASLSGANLSVGDLGGVFGSTLGRLLGINNLSGQVAAGTIIGSIGKEIGIALQYGTEFSFDSVVNGGLHRQNSQLGGLAAGAIGSLSSILFAELGEALHLNGFGNGLFQAVGTTVTTQLLTNVYNVTVLHQPSSGLFNGFGADQFAFNIAGAISNALFNQLAGEIVRPLTTEAAIGGSLGSSIGAYIGTVLIPIPILGSAIGAFIGRIAGTLFPNLASNGPTAFGHIGLDPDTGKLIDGGFFESNGGTSRPFRDIADQQVAAVNALVDLTGGHIEQATSWPSVDYSQQGTTFKMVATVSTNPPIGGTVFQAVNVQSSNDLNPMVNLTGMSLVRSIDIAGGDPFMRYVWENSQASNLTAFAADLQAAHDYRQYLDDKPAINALMAAEPESAFTTGWALTLLKARELGLDYQPQSDDFRNGNDSVNGTAGNDLLMGGLGGDTLLAFAGNDRLNGGADGDWLDGGAGNDILIGGSGYDMLIGGPGDDTFVVDNPGDIVREYAGGGSDTVIASITYTLTPEVENLTLLDGAGAIGGFGNAAASHIVGNESANSLGGGAGDDSLEGRGGNDVFDGGAGNDWLYGGAGNDWIEGGAGNDILIGGSGADTMIGGAGDDTLSVDDPGDVVREYAGGGSDTVNAAISFVLPAEIENLLLLAGAGAISGTGNGGDNRIAGNESANILAGGGGADVLTGGGGNDDLRGGAGADRAVFSGRRADYQIAFNAAAVSFTVSDLRAGAPDGVDTLRGIGTLVFSDGTLDLGPLGQQSVVHADGTRTVTAYDIDENEVWTTRITLFDSNDVRTSMYAICDDGTLDNAPTGATLSGGSVVENAPNGTAVGTVAGIDPDAGAVLSYALTQDAGGRFAINAATGVLTVANRELLDYGSAHAHAITVRVTDQGNLSVDKDFTIAVVDVPNTGTTPTMVAPADFNGDGRSDILWRHDDGYLSPWEMTNGGAVQAYQWLGMVSPGYHVQGTGDFNGDRKSDILMRHDNGAVTIWEMANGGAAQAYYALPSVATSWHIQNTGDFNGDGRSDILWRNDDGSVIIWEMANSGAAQAYRWLPSLPASWHIQGVNDFNGDGKSDILLRNDNGSLSIWQMGNNGQVAAFFDLGIVATGWHIQGTGDFNGDHRSDILWRHDDGSLRIWDMANSGQMQASHDFGIIPNSWHVDGIGDYNGDGKSDILWRHDDGYLSPWEMASGGTVQTMQWLGLVPTSWHLQENAQFYLV